VQPAAVEARSVVDAAALSEAVAREVRNEISRELGRDVINDLTHDVSREVSMAVSDEVTREVTSSVTRDVTDRVTREIRAMHTTLSEQLATLTWTDAMRRQPGRTKLMQDLILAGFSPSLARHIQSRLPDDQPADRATEWAKNILKRNLPIAQDAESLIDEGGVYALVGPTGVGKTTTVAKLAARFAMKHGVDQLALITTDGFRIGAQDQLRIYGKILGIQVLAIHDEGSLAAAVEQLSKKKLVLIDTAGMSQRDERVAEQIAMLRGAKAKRLVVLNATCDAETLEHVVATYADREFAGCVITKTDEAVRLGPALDVVVRNRLRIHHVSTGQKVPEDLERPDADALVDAALARVASRPAFELRTDDEPVWMSAMSGRADALDPALIMVPAVAMEVAHV
jgi:flagellar biosynthesis protein FlhF